MSDIFSPIEFHEGLKKYFNIERPNIYLDPVFMILRKVRINIIRFDVLLHKRHGQYEDDNLSMSTVIRKEYGVKAEAFIKSYL